MQLAALHNTLPPSTDLLGRLNDGKGLWKLVGTLDTNALGQAQLLRNTVAQTTAGHLPAVIRL
jgi:hypothetical protein